MMRKRREDRVLQPDDFCESNVNKECSSSVYSRDMKMMRFFSSLFLNCCFFLSPPKFLIDENRQKIFVHHSACLKIRIIEILL